MLTLVPAPSSPVAVPPNVQPELLSAERIVRIQESLLARHLGPSTRESLQSEQSELWERDHAGRAYEDIAHDVWLTRGASPVFEAA